jgi:HAD superfamily hydrolase (TIGR01484 family)
VRDVVASLADAEGTISCYPDADTWLMDRETEMTAHWRSHYQVAIEFARERIHDWRGPSCKVMFVAHPSLLPGIEQQVRQRFGARFHIVMSEPDRFEISPPGITKAWGLAHLAHHLGIERANVWAVGDAANDAEMISWAGHGCAMGQAPQAIRDRARHVLPGIQARGLCALPLLMARHA